MPKQAVTLLRQAEAGLANGKTTAEISCRIGISHQTYSRWRREYRGLNQDEARRLKQLEHENANLKLRVSELFLEKLVLRDLISSKGL
jgi:transcriptional regulator with XRE-family HTH domain